MAPNCNRSRRPCDSSDVGEERRQRHEIGGHLIGIDEDRGVFSVEGPMTAPGSLRLAGHRIVCGAAGVNHDALAAEFHRTRKLTDAPQ